MFTIEVGVNGVAVAAEHGYCHTMTPTSIELLLTVWEKLGPMERSVLNTYAHRLYAGQRKYGELDLEKKEWTWEAVEECLDTSVYLGALLFKFTEESKRRYFSSLDGTHYSVPEDEPKCGAV